jgi:uncharacterized membrane protein YgdD (TMEM256/DUF423 family)
MVRFGGPFSWPHSGRIVSPMMKLPLILAGLLGAAGVALGAASSHGLEDRLTPEALDWMATASRYMLWHALAIGLCGALACCLTAGRALAALKTAAALFTLGILLFCGSLLTLAFGGPRAAGAVAPIGGSALILGWLALAAAGLFAKSPSGTSPNHDS